MLFNGKEDLLLDVLESIQIEHVHVKVASSR
jgi:hypothetical protein